MERASTLSGDRLRIAATPSRQKCGLGEPVHTVTWSPLISTTPQPGPMLEWDWNGHSYSASITRAAVLKAASTSPFCFSTSRLRTGALRMWS